MSTYWISIHGGNPDDPMKLGRRPEFVSGGYEWLIDETAAAYERGWSFVRWHQARGSPVGQRLYPSACGRQVHTAQEIAVLDRRMHTLPRAPGLYSGVWIDTANSLVLADARARYPDPTKPNDAAWLRANWELFFGYGVRDVMLDNSVVNPQGAARLSGWFAAEGAVMGIEGWDVEWGAGAVPGSFGGLSWRMPSMHTLFILDRHDPRRELTVRPPASAKHRPTVLVQRAWDVDRGMHTPAEEIVGRILELKARGFRVEYQGKDDPLIQQACCSLMVGRS